MILKEFNIKELEMNGMSVGFEKAKVTVEVNNIHIYGSIKVRSVSWFLTVEYIAVILDYIHKHKVLIEIEMVTDQGEKLSGMGRVTALEDKVLTEITGVGELKGAGVE